MTGQELEIIITKHEMQRMELKESFGAEAIETVCAFANAGGGLIIIGVDNTGVPSKRTLRLEALRDYENKIATATEPSVAVDAEKVAEIKGTDPIKKSSFPKKNFSNRWKTRENFFQSLEKSPQIFQPLDNFFPIIGKLPFSR